MCDRLSSNLTASEMKICKDREIAGDDVISPNTIGTFSMGTGIGLTFVVQMAVVSLIAATGLLIYIGVRLFLVSRVFCVAADWKRDL
jgi:hypothetical protein